MCLPPDSVSATTGSGAPYAFGGSSTTAINNPVTANDATMALGMAGGGLRLFSALSGASAQTTADNAQADAAAQKSGTYQAAAASVSPTLAGAASLLTSATSVSADWYRNQRAGVQ
jgi:hypothetical protein